MNKQQADEKINFALNADYAHTNPSREERMQEATVYALQGVMGELDRLSTAIEEMNNNNDAEFNRQLWNVESEKSK